MNSFLTIDPSKPQTIADFVSECWFSRWNYKYGLERQWFINIACFKGNQNVIWDDVSKRLREPEAPPWKVRLVVNLLQGAVRTNVSKIYRPRVEWDIIPPTTDPQDIQTAQLDKYVLQYYWKLLNLDAKLLDATEWMCQTGNVFLKVCWNPDKGPPFDVTHKDLLDTYYTNEPTEMAQRSGKLSGLSKLFKSLTGSTENNTTLRLGDLDVEVVSPFEMMLEPNAVSLEEANWVLRSKIQDVEVIKEDWGEYAKDVSADYSATSTNSQFNLRKRLQLLNNKTGQFVTSGGDIEENNAIIHELWIKPRGKGKLKNGLYAVICQGHVLNGNGKGVEFPYEHGRLPFIHMTEIPVKGTPWGTSVLEQLLNIQMDYNRTKSQLIENRNLMGRPKWLSPLGAKLDGNSITNEPGEVIEYSVGMKPEMVSPPSLPSYIENLLVSYRQDLEDISGQHEVSRAESPGEVRSGRGVIALIEQDETRLGPIIDRIDRSIAEIGKLSLSTLVQYVREDRLSRIIGDDDELMIQTWSGKALLGKNYGRPNIEYFDVRIATIAGLPNSRAAQSAFVDNLLTRQVLDPVSDRKLIFKLLGIGKAQNMLDNSRGHRSRAILENQAMSKGQQVQVFTYQDHAAHLEVLNAYRNSTEYDALPEEIKQLFVVHEQQHKEAQALVEVEPEILQRAAIQKLLMAHNIMPPVTGESGNQQQPISE